MENENVNEDLLGAALVVEPPLPIAVEPLPVELMPAPVAAVKPLVPDRPHKCYHCDARTFPNLRAIQKHNRDVHKEGRYACGTCGTTFIFLPDRNVHQENVHQGNP